MWIHLKLTEYLPLNHRSLQRNPNQNQLILSSFNSKAVKLKMISYSGIQIILTNLHIKKMSKGLRLAIINSVPTTKPVTEQHAFWYLTLQKKATMKRKVANWISWIPQQYHTASAWSNSQNILKNETEILIAASLQYNELEELDLAYSIQYCRRPSFPTHVVCNILFFLPSVLSPRYSISQCWNHVSNFVMKINN